MIKKQVEELLTAIANHQAEIDVLRAQITAIQTHKCKHPNAQSFRSGDYSGATYTVFACPDCGINEER